MQVQEPDLDLTYEQALRAASRARARSIVPELSVLAPPFPDSNVDPVIQVKLAAITQLMAVLGQLPGDYPRAKFDRPIRYRALSQASLDWLEHCGIAARGLVPLATRAYIPLFGTEESSPVPQQSVGRFWGRLIHWLTIETQVTIAKQFYHGLDLYQAYFPLAMLAEMLPDEAEGMQLASLPAIDFTQLHGMLFLEYCAVMIRAQWDKLIRLSCLPFGVSHNWRSISDGLAALGQKLDTAIDLHPWCLHHARTLLQLAKERTAEDGWLKSFRDPLLHDVGEHPAGVIPHRRSLQTTSEMWDHVCDEHDWVREGMMATLAVMISIKSANESTR